MNRFLLYSVVMLLLICAANAVSQTMVTDVICQIVKETPRSDELEKIAEKLIVVEKDKELDSAALKESIDALKVCRVFERVEVEQTAGQIKFLLTPAQYVRNIRIRHELPLFEDDVEKAMSTSSGDMFVPEILTQQDSLITALYRREGFVCPDVEVTSKVHRTGVNQIISVRVEPGGYYRVRSLDIEGNNAVSDLGIKRRMKTWRSSLVPGSAGRFIESFISDDIKLLVKYYRSKGFADIQIRDTVIADSSSRSVRVVLTVDEGDKYRIQFSRKRDRGFRKSVFRKDIVLEKSGNSNNQGIRKSVKAIEKHLHETGFLDAKVTASDTTVTKRSLTKKNVRFNIKRGERTTVESITFDGAVSLPEKLLRGQMLHVDKGRKAKRAYNPEKLEEDVFAVQMLYRSRGFLRATAQSKVSVKDRTAAIAIEVHEGQCTHVGKVSVDTGQLTNSEIHKAITVSAGDPYRPDLVKRDARVLQTVIAEQGYPHAEVTPVAAVSSDSSSVDINYHIVKGPLVYMGDIRFVGAFRTREKILRNEVKASPGDPLSLKKIVDTQKGLRDLGPLSSVRFRTIGLREKRDTVHVFVEVAEKRSMYGTVGGGYQSDKGPYVHSKAGDRNVFGFNKEAWIAGEISMIGRQGEVGFLEPRLFGSHVNATIRVFGEKTSELNQDWGTTAYGVSGGLITSLSKYLVLGLGTVYERRQLFLENGAVSIDTTLISDDQHPRNILTITPSATLDRRDSFTRPRKGTVLSSSVDISKGLENSLDNIVKVQAETKGYITPFSQLTFAAVVRGGYLYSYGNYATIPANRNFYLGGTGDLRGFAENLFHQDSSGGKTMLFASIEARVEVGFNIEWPLFFDAGRVENSFTSVSTDQFRSSAGTGLRYITPIGPVGILYGWKLNKKTGESPGAFHFSLGYTF